jgi:pyruvate formate lyase activating enzyme
MDPRPITRRAFCSAAARWSACASGAALVGFEPLLRHLAGESSGTAWPQPLDELLRQAPVARFWTSTAETGVGCTTCHEAGQVDGQHYDHQPPAVKCLLCAHGCTIAAGKRGRCRARINADGQLRSLVYGRPITEHVDPIEKKPFYHFLPGSAAYSLATSGCPLRCRFCQNWEISQARPEDYTAAYCAPEAMVERALGAPAPVIAFTYNEPTVFFEYLTDIARQARGRRLRSVLISCGYMNQDPLAEMIEVLDAIKIDLKGFNPEFYRQVSSAELAPVLRSIAQVARAGRHLELVNLVVPTLNDSETALAGLADWVVGELGPDVPVHFTRFHPDYQLQNLPPTPVATLERARQLAMDRGIRYAYVGNLPGHPGNHTYCPKCGRVCVERSGFLVTRNEVQDGRCRYCRTPIAGVWN